MGFNPYLYSTLRGGSLPEDGTDGDHDDAKSASVRGLYSPEELSIKQART